MPFLNVPLKTISCEITDILGVQSMPWYNPSGFPVPPGFPYPNPEPRNFRWKVTLQIELQQHSSYLTRNPGLYNGQDVAVGQWIANSSTGKAWQIISVESKTDLEVIAIIQDVYRYNTFRDGLQTGNGSPDFGTYVIFSTSDAGLPQIDPVPASGVSASFTENIQSRFEYINLQYDYPLYADGNTFVLGDVIAVDPDNNSFTLADDSHRTVIGRVTSISDTKPGWFTLNPAQKIVDNLDFLPGDVGDTIYVSTVDPGELTIDPGGPAIYINLRKNTSSISFSTLPGPTTPGSVFQLNGTDITVDGFGSATDIVDAVNPQAPFTGVSANLQLLPSVSETVPGNISSTYGEIVLYAATSPATATINGISVTFNIRSTSPGYEDYTQAAQMAEAINNANIPNIVASSPIPQTLMLTNSTGSAITIVNGTSDTAGVPFAGANSGSGLNLSTPASTNYQIQFTAIDARAINFLDVVGSTLIDFGLVSVENGIKAAGLYIAQGLRTAAITTVMDLTQLNGLTPLIGDQAYVIDSDDGQGNNVGEWSMWIFDGVEWVETSNQDSATTDAKSLEYTLTTSTPAVINIGNISTGRRVTLITIEVTTPFDGTPTLNIGYQVNNPVPPPAVSDGLMSSLIIDLTVAGTYTTTSDILFGTDTVQGDVTVTGNFVLGGATVGVAQIIVSYV